MWVHLFFVEKYSKYLKIDIVLFQPNLELEESVDSMFYLLFVKKKKSPGIRGRKPGLSRAHENWQVWAVGAFGGLQTARAPLLASAPLPAEAPTRQAAVLGGTL